MFRPPKIFYAFGLLVFLHTASGEVEKTEWKPIVEAMAALKGKNTAQYLFRNISKVAENMDPGDHCIEDLETLMAAFTDPLFYDWAGRMGNANGQFPTAGAYEGLIHYVGNYDQCHKVKPTGQKVYLGDPENGIFVGIHRFGGKYCRMTWTIHPRAPGLSFGECVPDSCTPATIAALAPAGIPGILTLVDCGEKPPLKTNTGAIVAITITSFFVALVIIATLVDAGLTLRNRRIQNSKKTQVQTNGICNKGMDIQELDMTQPGAKVTKEIEPRKPLPPKSSCAGKAMSSLLAFSLGKNVPALLSTHTPPGAYNCMNAVRVFSFMWIVLGHIWQLHLEKFSANLGALGELRGRFGHMIINNIIQGVIPFFLMSGALIFISFTKTIKRIDNSRGGRKWLLVLKELALYVIHRYLRLTPVLAAIMMIWGNLWKYFGYGPLYPTYMGEAEYCQKNWWQNVLYIQNLIWKDPCMGWTWYLAVDFQCFLVVPIFAFFMYISPLFGSIFLFLGWAGSLVARGYFVENHKDGFADVYIKPWTRFGPYAMGMALGYILYITKCKVRMNKVVLAIGWIVAIGLGIFGVWGNYGSSPQGYQLFFHIVKYEAFALGVGWVIFVCCTGNGGLADTFLSWKLWVPLSRLTYIGYLIHIIIHIHTLGSFKSLLYVQDITMIYIFLGNLVLTLLVSFGLALVFELPFLNLDKLFLSNKKKK